MEKIKPLIRLSCDTSICLTVQEYESLIHELQIKQIADTITLGDRVLAIMLHVMFWRYSQAKALEELEK